MNFEGWLTNKKTGEPLDKKTMRWKVLDLKQWSLVTSEQIVYKDGTVFDPSEGKNGRKKNHPTGFCITKRGRWVLNRIREEYAEFKSAREPDTLP